MLTRAISLLAALCLSFISSSAFGFIPRTSPLDASDAVSEPRAQRAPAVEADESPPIRRCEVCLSRLALAYAGQQWDQDVGLSYAQQRWYDPGTGRFLSEDPVFGDLENPMSLHPFVYANGNPLRYADPTGERAATPEEEAELALWEAAAKKNRASYDGRSAAGQWWSRLRRGSDYSAWATLDANITRRRAAIDAADDGEPVLATPFVSEGGLFVSASTDVSLGNGTKQNLFDMPVYITGTQAAAHKRWQSIADISSSAAGSFTYCVRTLFYNDTEEERLQRALGSAGAERVLQAFGAGGFKDQRSTATVQATDAYIAKQTDSTPALSGGRAAKWTWGTDAIPEKQAEGAYEAIRQSTTDVDAIARYIGYKAPRISRIKQYLFSNPDWTGADPEIAAAWHRLRTGRSTEIDRLLLKHETAEMWYRANVNNDYSPAHSRANQHWNWQRAVKGQNAE